MTTVQKWTGRETRALRQALRMSIRDFSAHLGVAERTVSKWEAAMEAACPRPEMQAALDTALGSAAEDARSRFASTQRNDAGLAVTAEVASDLAAAARRRLADVRSAVGLSPEAFARLLGTILGWSPTAQRVIDWETTETPPGDILLALDVLRGPAADNLAGLIAVFPSRSQLTAHLPAERLLDGARRVRAIGLSLNMLCQDYADRHWQALLASGTHARCLFLDPAGTAIKAREAEEGFLSGQLAALTKLNLETLLRVRERLPVELRTRMELATYDETLRFNVVLADDQCVAQPYLTDSRGVDSPAFVIQRDAHRTGLYQVFEQFFESHWQRGKAL
ncbi:DUF5919 domain-containing protein [Micromonospora aurantiaca (nom. illeg.)]|uniref:DUF5919 domain-containing protein n=1 Tax=Micromonospora aurantiaca (nom. illeg.) TaxID=47850 RepID=UPI001656A254|nr:DUF5919 domain-containing protein [Micromonospora aurantiaca]MBC9006902.1 hypothetical protein [Micromonospora aurantiaca]